MSSLTRPKTKKIDLPPTPAPAATPTQVSPEVQAKAGATLRRFRSGRGRRGTILTTDDEKREELG